MLSPTIIRLATVGTTQFVALSFTNTDGRQVCALQSYDVSLAPDTKLIHSEGWGTEAGACGALDRLVKVHEDAAALSVVDLEDDDDAGRYTLITWARDAEGNKIGGYEREYAGSLDPQRAAEDLESYAWLNVPYPASVDTPQRLLPGASEPGNIEVLGETYCAEFHKAGRDHCAHCI